MQERSCFDLNALPMGVMIYDPAERLLAWNDPVTRFYPVITPWLAVGATLESLAEKFIDAGYNIDPGRRQTLREAIIRNCRQPSHREVRQSGQRRLYVQHQRLADGGIISLHTDITELDEAKALAPPAARRFFTYRGVDPDRHLGLAGLPRQPAGERYPAGDGGRVAHAVALSAALFA